MKPRVMMIAVLMATSSGHVDSQTLKTLPPEMERLLIKRGDIPGFDEPPPVTSYASRAGYWWSRHLIAAERTPPGVTLMAQCFYTSGIFSKQLTDEEYKGRITIRIEYCDDILRALEVAAGRISEGQLGLMPEGTLSGLPLGADVTWCSRSITGPETAYGLAMWKDNVFLKVNFHRFGSMLRQPLSQSEIHLVENVGRKLLANMEGREFTITKVAPRSWTVMPVAMHQNDKPVKMGKIISWKGELLTAPATLATLGLTVKAARLVLPRPPTYAATKSRKSKATPGRISYLKLFTDHYLKKIKTVDVKKGQTHLRFTLGEKFYLLNGKRTTLDTPARLIDGQPMVPLEVVARDLNLPLEWDSKKRVAKLGRQ